MSERLGFFFLWNVLFFRPRALLWCILSPARTRSSPLFTVRLFTRAALAGLRLQLTEERVVLRDKLYCSPHVLGELSKT